MEDELITGVFALLAATVGVLGLEGGAARRAIRLVREEVELVRLLDPDDPQTVELEAHARKKLHLYLETFWERWMRRSEQTLTILSVAAFIFVALDLLTSALDRVRPSTFSLIVGGTSLGVLGLIALIGTITRLWTNRERMAELIRRPPWS